MNVKRILRRFKDQYEVNYTYRFYSEQFKKYLIMHEIPNEPAVGEDDYVRLWKSLSKRVEPYSYRLFSHYMKEEKRKYIVPEDIGHSVIEYYLNPIEYRAFYKDKNLFSQYIRPRESLPKELLRRIDGGQFLDGDYQVGRITRDSSKYDVADEYSGIERIIIKPSANSCSGSQVKLFQRVLEDDEKSCFVDDNGCPLDGDFLSRYNYGRNFVLQEAIGQHPYISQFCSTSVNTMRLCTYRSVTDESILMFAAALRIGHEGSVVDNLHAGGGFVKIDVETGKLGHELYDRYGNVSKSINGVNMENDFQIPGWKSIYEFGISIAKQNHHMRLLALDVALDANNKPRLIEYNCVDFAFWIPMFTGQQVFGDKMEEVIEYCQKRLAQDNRI